MWFVSQKLRFMIEITDQIPLMVLFQWLKSKICENPRKIFENLEPGARDVIAAQI